MIFFSEIHAWDIWLNFVIAIDHRRIFLAGLWLPIYLLVASHKHSSHAGLKEVIVEL